MPTLLKSICLTFALFVFVADTSTCQQTLSDVPSDSLSLRLYFDTTDYLYGQNIIAHVTLINNSTHTIEVCDIRSDYRVLSLTNIEGKSLTQQEMHINYGTGQRKHSLTAGDSLVSPHYLCRSGGPTYGKRDGTDCLTIGETQVRAGYQNQVFSPFVTIRLDQPTGNENLAYEVFRRVFQGGKTRDRMRPLAVIDSLIETYPKSKYVPDACKHGLLQAKLINDSDRIANYCTILIQSDPNHEYSIAGFDNFLTVLPASSAASFCDSIATAYPNTRLAVHAREKLAILNAEKR